jgi:TRAP-type mannitol/chloroaromatic compound transport system permease small subunit
MKMKFSRTNRAIVLFFLLTLIILCVPTIYVAANIGKSVQSGLPSADPASVIQYNTIVFLIQGWTLWSIAAVGVTVIIIIKRELKQK